MVRIGCHAIVLTAQGSQDGGPTIRVLQPPDGCTLHEFVASNLWLLDALVQHSQDPLVLLVSFRPKATPRLCIAILRKAASLQHLREPSKCCR